MKHVYERNVPLTTRDGVTLPANAWRPLEGQAPTPLMRHPYNAARTTSKPARSLVGPPARSPHCCPS